MKKIAVIMGGISSEREVSLISGIGVVKSLKTHPGLKKLLKKNQM
jgi:D-alanine-D-alanine ligase-like ATP-grasp enzyme